MPYNGKKIHKGILLFFNGEKNFALNIVIFFCLQTTTKPDMPVLKKRGRNSLQQDQSPGNASAKMPVSSDGKTPKNKPPTTPGGSASKTRTTRSNSTEIKSEGLQGTLKHLQVQGKSSIKN